MSQDRLLDRFLRYVRVDTTAVDNAGRYPSSPGQLELGKMLVAELQAMGITDAAQDEHGIVMATVPGTVAGSPPVICFNSHLDTSPETTGKGVRPNVIRNYAGGDIPLAGDDRTIHVADNPELDSLRGKTIITTDGSTLLGADDKAGIAAIMEAAQRWMEDRKLPRGPVRILFTCDEEIGHGVDHVDLKKLGATVAYTLDGSATGEIDGETFSADGATVTIRGVNIHPSIGKGKMKNALRAAATFISQLPSETLAPEVTEGREGFIHPYTIEGGVAQVTIRVLLRDFDTPRLAEYAEILENAAKETMRRHPGVEVKPVVKEQYRNMAAGLAKEPRAVAFAKEAHDRLGLPVKLTVIRGGTDGSRFTELGLPTPNLSTGEHNPHSPLEWTCLEEMEQAVRVIHKVAEVWSEAR